MITLNLNEDKRLKFSYGVANIHPDDIMGKFILDFGDSFVGFPIKINDQKIVVEVKSLNKFLTEAVGVVKARLEIVASDTFLVPWNGQVRINGPVRMTVKEEMPIRKEAPVEKYVAEEEEKVIEPEIIEPLFEDEDHLKRLLSLGEEEMIEKIKDEEKVKQEEIFSNFLDTPIEELI